MPIADSKKVQSFIQGLVEAVKLLRQADVVAQDMKAKFAAHKPNLAGANLTQVEKDATVGFLKDLHSLATGAVATVILSKDMPSHGTGALD